MRMRVDIKGHCGVVGHDSGLEAGGYLFEPHQRSITSACKAASGAQHLLLNTTKAQFNRTN
jgi:hypothetical protein